MRVLIVSHRFPPDAVAGVERYSESLAARLASMGDRVAVATRRPGPGPVRTESESRPEGYAVHRFVGGGVDRGRPFHLAEPLDAEFARLLEAHRPDVVHLNHLVDLSPRFVPLAREAGAAVVVTLHDFWFSCHRITLQRPDGTLCDGPRGGRSCAEHCMQGDARDRSRAGLRAMYLGRLLSGADLVLAPSRFVAEWFLEHASVHVRAVPNGIAFPRVRPVGPASARDPGAPLRLAILGAIVPHKGHHVAVEAVAETGLDSVELFVHGPIGDAGYVRGLRDAADLVPGLRLRICGPYAPEDLDLLLEDVDALLVPSVWPETFCLVAREALVRGVPVITTELGALPDAVEDGENGLLYAHDRPGELARALRRLRDEPRLLGDLRAGARRTRVISVAEHAETIRTLYAEALSRRPRSAPSDFGLEVLESAIADVVPSRGVA